MAGKKEKNRPARRPLVSVGHMEGERGGGGLLPLPCFPEIMAAVEKGKKGGERVDALLLRQKKKKKRKKKSKLFCSCHWPVQRDE